MILHRVPCALTLAALIGLAGCAAPPPVAVVAYTHEDCTAEPELATALRLAPPKPKTTFVSFAKLDESAGCLHTATGDAPYRVYVLPKPTQGKTFTAGSMLEGARLVPPRVSVLDETGKIVRTFDAKDYFFRGSIYSVQFRPRTGEAYILITVERGQIGKRYDSIVTGLSTTTSTTARGGRFSWSSGLDQSISRGFSYEGVVLVEVYDPNAAPPR